MTTPFCILDLRIGIKNQNPSFNYLPYTHKCQKNKFSGFAPLAPQFWATVYTQITKTINFLVFAPLAPQFWGENSEKVPQDWGI